VPWPKTLFWLVCTMVLAHAAPVQGQANPPARLLGPLPNSTGDLDALLARRAFRLIVPYSKTLFFIDRGRQHGLIAEFGREFEAWLNERHGSKAIRQYVLFIPTPREKMIEALLAGQGDAIAANLTVTPEREQQVDFAKPLLTDVREILITGPAAPPLAGLDDLAGREVPVRASSSYAEHLRRLSSDFEKAGKKPIRLQFVRQELEDEDLIEMVQAGLLPFAVVDEHKARPWKAVYPQLVLRDDIVVSAGGTIAWAIRKDSPKLKAELDAFFESRKQGTSFGNTLLRRYFGGKNSVRPASNAVEIEKFNLLLASFRKHGLDQGFDYLMLAAQGYQESQLDQSRQSPRGAVGIMQLLPRTAAAPPVNMRDVASSADTNIRAGAIYMRHLRDTYVNDPMLDPQNRLLMTLAAYNAGPGNLRKFRRIAVEKGLNPNLWFNNVEHAAASVVGRETVQYVSNIYKYYITYSLIDERMRAGTATQESFKAGN